MEISSYQITGKYKKKEARNIDLDNDVLDLRLKEWVPLREVRRGEYIKLGSSNRKGNDCQHKEIKQDFKENLYNPLSGK